jgi:ankyrin repeat protein
VTSKAQYETRLKKWGLHKYASGGDRRTLLSVLPSHSIGREESERRLKDLSNDVTTAGESYDLLQPQSNIDHVIASSTSRHKANTESSSLGHTLEFPIDGLPSALLSSSSLTGGWKNLSSATTTDFTFQSLSVGDEVGSTSSQNDMQTLSCFLGEERSTNLLGQTFTSGSTVPATSKHLRSQGLSGNSFDLDLYVEDQNTMEPVHWDDSGAPLPNAFSDGFLPRSTTSSNHFCILEFATTMLPNLARILPNIATPGSMILLEQRKEFESAGKNWFHPSTTHLLRQQSFHHRVVHMILHRLINDESAVRALEEPETKFDKLYKAGLEHVFSLGAQVLGDMIDSTSSYHRLALMQSVFCAALVLGNGSIVELILDRKDLSRLKFTTISGPHYPLEYVCHAGHSDVARILLKRGAAHDRSIGMFVFESILRRGSTSKPPIRHKMVQMLGLLLNSNVQICRISSSLFETYSIEVVQLLAVHVKAEYPDSPPDMSILTDMLLRSQWNDLSVDTLRWILQKYNSIDAGSRGLWDSKLADCLSNALLRKHTPATDILLSFGVKPNVDCLIIAIRSDDSDLSRDLLDMGVNPTALCTDVLWNLEDGYVNALSESIRKSSRLIFHMICERGCLPELADNPNEFHPVLLAACEIGDSKLVAQLLSLRNFQWDNLRLRRSRLMESGWGSAIEAAVRMGNDYIFRQLLSAGIRPTYECLELAITSKQTIFIESLLHLLDAHGIQSRLQKYFAEILRWGDVRLMEYSIQNGACLDAPFYFNIDEIPILGLHECWRKFHILRRTTPLGAAILCGNTASVQLLLASGAGIGSPSGAMRYNAQEFTALAACVARHDITLLTELLCRGADPGDDSAICMATVLGMEDIIRQLLQAFKQRYSHGKSSFGLYALYWAVSQEDMPLLKLLVEFVDMTGSMYPFVSVTQLSFSPPPPPPPTTDFTSPLGEAIRMESVQNVTHQVLHFLLPRIKDPNAIVFAKSGCGKMTSLLYAIHLGSMDTFLTLAKNGADLALPAQCGILRTPLQAATEAGHKDIVEYLLQQHVSSNELPAIRAGATALQLAAIKGFMGIAALLLHAGADVNAEPALFDGRTAFEGATEHGRIDMMLFLVANGADLLSHDSRQYRRAVQFAKLNTQYAAKQLADELLATALKDKEASQTPADFTFDVDNFIDFSMCDDVF